MSARRHCPTALLAIAALMLLAAAPTPAQTIVNPDLFAKSAKAAHEALEVYGPLDDAAELERVNRIGYAIARHSGFDKYPFSFFIIDMAVPNAFALPAGHVFITRGMLELGLDDDMLAGLLGHEIAHVTQEHFLRMRKRATLLNVLSQVLTVGAIVGASQDQGDTYVDGWGVVRRENDTAGLVQGVAATGMLVTELLLRSYSRANEDESDEEGQRFAAAAGFDPEGTQRLMAKMEERLPQDESFGYWQTHPFFAERVRAARARQSTLKVQEPRPVDDYRMRSQHSLLDFAVAAGDEQIVEIVESAALAAWPAGAAAEGIRSKRLHSARQATEAAKPLGRDYGSLLALYQKELELVFGLTPESPFLATLQKEMADLSRRRDSVYPAAVDVLEGGVYETPFLETFVSNYPDSELRPRAALALGESYARLTKETEAVENLLLAWQSEADPAVAESAGRGLRVLAPRLDRLAALQFLAEQEKDAQLAHLADERLTEQATRFESLENGAEFLDRYGAHHLATTVRKRQDDLADELYKEVVVYQRMGDHAKAVHGIHQILNLAPLSPAAKALGDTVLDTG
jgi:predicted Zn-dependent protease